MAASETAHSMSRYLISISTYLTSAKRVRTFQPNLVEYECDPPCLRYHVIYDVITSAKTNLKVMSDRLNSSICKYFDIVMNLVHALPLTHHLRSLIHHTDSYTTLLSLFTIELHFLSSIALTTHSWHQSHITLIALLITQSHTLYKPGASTQISPSIV